MSEREQKERTIAEAKSFLEEQGILESVQSFLDSDEAIRIIQYGFNLMMEELSAYFKESPPVEPINSLEELYKMCANQKAKFFADATANLMVKLYVSLKRLPEAIFMWMAEKNYLVHAFQNGKELLIKDLNEVVQDVTSYYINKFIEILYLKF